MSNKLSHYLQRRKARRHFVKINDMKNIGKKAHLQVEAHASLGNLQIQPPSETVRIGAYSYMRSSELMHISEIGRFCSIGQNVQLGMNPRNHPIDWASTCEHISKGYRPIVANTSIGHDVWIGHNASIMAGLRIGTGAVIGTQAVVTRDVPPYSIVVGNPARIVKYRFSELVITALLASRWWEKPLTLLQTLRPENPVSFARSAAQLTDIAQYSVTEIVGRNIRPTPLPFIQFTEDNINPNDAVNNQPSPSLTLDS